MPSATDFTNRQLHRDFFFGYKPSIQGLLARGLVPEINGDVAGEILSLSAADSYRLWDDAVGASGMANLVEWLPTTVTYDTSERALKGFIKKRTVDRARAAGAEALFTLEQKKIAQIRNALDLAYEDRVAARLNDTGVFANTAATAAFGAAGDAPIADIQDLIVARHSATGIWPNTVIFSGTDTWVRWSRTSEVRDYISQNLAQKVRTATIPIAVDVLNVGGMPDFQVLIGGAVKNTAGFGLAASFATVWTTARVIVAYFDRNLPQAAAATPQRPAGAPGDFDGATTPVASVFGPDHGNVDTWDSTEPKGRYVRIDYDYTLVNGQTGTNGVAAILTGA